MFITFQNLTYWKSNKMFMIFSCLLIFLCFWQMLNKMGDGWTEAHRPKLPTFSLVTTPVQLICRDQSRKFDKNISRQSQLIVCAECSLCVHTACYCVSPPSSSSSPWLCNHCSSNDSTKVSFKCSCNIFKIWMKIILW